MKPSNSRHKILEAYKIYAVVGILIFFIFQPLLSYGQNEIWESAFITNGCFLSSLQRYEDGKHKTIAYLPYGTVIYYTKSDTIKIHKRINYKIRTENGFEGYLPKSYNDDILFKDIPAGNHIISIDKEFPLWVHRISNNKTKRYTSFGMYDGMFLTIISGPQFGWYYVDLSWIKDEFTQPVFQEMNILEEKAKIIIVHNTSKINENWVTIEEDFNFDIKNEIINRIGTNTIARSDVETYIESLKRCETECNANNAIHYNFKNQEIGILNHLLNSKNKGSKITFDYYQMTNISGGNSLRIIIAKLYQCDEESRLMKCFFTICNKNYRGNFFKNISPDHIIPDRPVDVANEYKAGVGRGYMGVIDGSKASEYFLKSIISQIPECGLNLEEQQYNTLLNFLLYKTHFVFQPKS